MNSFAVWPSAASPFGTKSPRSGLNGNCEFNEGGCLGVRLRHLRSHLVDEGEHFAHLVVEEVADEQVREVALIFGVVANEGAEAESIVVLADQPAHSLHSRAELCFPLS